MNSKICLKCEMYESRLVAGIRVGCRCAEPQLLAIPDMAELPKAEMDANPLLQFNLYRNRGLVEIVRDGKMHEYTEISLAAIIEGMGYYLESVKEIIAQIKAEGLALRNSGPCLGDNPKWQAWTAEFAVKAVATC